MIDSTGLTDQIGDYIMVPEPLVARGSKNGPIESACFVAPYFIQIPKDSFRIHCLLVTA